MEVLTRRSARVGNARQLTRRSVRSERREFLAEGPQAVREALAIPGCVRTVFVTSDALDQHRELESAVAAGGIELLRCDDRALAELAGSVTPQGVVAVCRFVDVSIEAALAGEPRLVAVAAHLRDPGNAGTLIRCADAAGADAVVLAGSSVDVYNDKVVRASVGSLFHLPVVVGTTVTAAVTALRGRGLAVLAADGAADLSLDVMIDTRALTTPVAWVFGNEAWGVPAEERDLCDHSVAVPLYGRAESLNVATAAAVCLYATARAQRGVSS